VVQGPITTLMRGKSSSELSEEGSSGCRVIQQSHACLLKQYDQCQRVPPPDIAVWSTAEMLPTVSGTRGLSYLVSARAVDVSNWICSENVHYHIGMCVQWSESGEATRAKKPWRTKLGPNDPSRQQEVGGSPVAKPVHVRSCIC
jgi:hypothetical protein